MQHCLTPGLASATLVILELVRNALRAPPDRLVQPVIVLVPNALNQLLVLLEASALQLVLPGITCRAPHVWLVRRVHIPQHLGQRRHA